MNFKGIFIWFKLISWISIPFVLLLLPVNFFDSGKSLCLSQLLLSQECPGCGITRGVQHAIHFDFKVAWEHNKLTVVVLPILIGFWINTIFNLFKKIKNS